jgi:hypothetical protein
MIDLIKIFVSRLRKTMLSHMPFEMTITQRTSHTKRLAMESSQWESIELIYLTEGNNNARSHNPIYSLTL